MGRIKSGVRVSASFQKNPRWILSYTAAEKEGYDLWGFVLIPYLGRLGSGPRITGQSGQIWLKYGLVPAKKGYDLGGFVLLPYLGRLGSGPRITGQIWSEYGLVPAKKAITTSSYLMPNTSAKLISINCGK